MIQQKVAALSETKYYDFVVSDAAQRRIDDCLSVEGENAKLRIRVLGGGCSGFKYEYSFTIGVANDDHVYGEKNVVVIDNVSISLIDGGVLDYEESLGHSGFIIKNPNSSARCGCGNSFAI